MHFAVLWAVAMIGCGSDVNVSFRSSFGTVAEDASCRDRGGEFPLRNQTGLTVTVIVTDDTTIVLANGSFGSCEDIGAGSTARVEGRDADGAISAREVEILGT